MFKRIRAMASQAANLLSDVSASFSVAFADFSGIEIPIQSFDLSESNFSTAESTSKSSHVGVNVS